MFKKTLNPELADRLRRYAHGIGSAKDKATILDWVGRAELGDDIACRNDALKELVRAITLLACVRAYYGVRQTAKGYEVDLITKPDADFVEAQILQMEIADHFKLKKKTVRVLAGVSSATAADIFNQLTQAFQAIFEK
jgi:hypothetical protein